MELNQEQNKKEKEQAAFEDWLYSSCPSGDHDSIQRQWLESWDYLDFCNQEDDDEKTCRSCECVEDLVFDDDGELVCCDCLFEEESHEINQP